MSYSVDFRRQVLSIRRREGLSFAQASARFGVGPASLKRWAKRLEPLSYKRKSRKINLEKLAEDVRLYPDAYQHERAVRFGVTQKAIWQALREIGVSYKKNLKHPKADENERHIFRNKVKGYKEQGKAVVYIDESGFAHDMPRTHGYAVKGQRCLAPVTGMHGAEPMSLVP